MEWKNIIKGEALGTRRDLAPVELEYFDFRIQRYTHQSVLRDQKYNVWDQAPHSFHLQYQNWKVWYKPPRTELLEKLHQFTSTYLGDQPRMQWQEFLGDIEGGKESKFCWCLLFMKSTNGVSDKVSVGHFAALIRKAKAGPLSLKQLTNDHFVAAILRQTSKWVMNTVSRASLLDYQSSPVIF